MLLQELREVPWIYSVEIYGVDRTSGWLMLKGLLCWLFFRLHTALQYLKKAQKIEEKLEAQYSKAGLRGFLIGSELVQGLMGDAKIQQAVKADSWVQHFLRSSCSCLIAVWGTHLNLCALLSQMGKHQEAQGSVMDATWQWGGLSKRILEPEIRRCNMLTKPWRSWRPDIGFNLFVL